MATLENVEIKDNAGSESIVFKGYRSGLALIIPDEGPFEHYLQKISEHLSKSQNFFSGAKISLQLGSRELSTEERTKLIQLFQANGLVLRNPTERAGSTPRTREAKQTVHETNITPTITVKKTLRSGQLVEFEGNVLVMGDVNPGAEVIAGGDIIVLGKLRGTVHAGAEGDRTSQIFAFQINPVQIRIADSIARGADKIKRSKDIRPEVAKIKENQIIVEKFNP